MLFRSYLVGSLGPFAMGWTWSAWGWTGAVALAFVALAVALGLTALLRRSAPKAETGPMLS